LVSALELDSVLLFISAGVFVANFTERGDELIENVERLSTPVYVVFFVLAGARLHLHDLAVMWPFALALVVVRAVAIQVGIAVGGRLGKASDATLKYGWLGFLSQAGVTLTLATIVGDSFGTPGENLRTLLIAAIAFNELLGPVALKMALSFSGELQGDTMTNRNGSGAPADRRTLPPDEPVKQKT
ncbi:MAG: hypothetical protein KC416_13045, partial [Myxococcales bacterium]|nr:hypothetical protein [Myxococcales bacterium]